MQHWALLLREFLYGLNYYNIVVQFDAADAGGSCTEDCYNKHALALDLTDQWVEHSVTWDMLEQDPNNGGLVSFDSGAIVTVDFQVGPESDFDFWVDDISFF